MDKSFVLCMCARVCLLRLWTKGLYVLCVDGEGDYEFKFCGILEMRANFSRREEMRDATQVYLFSINFSQYFHYMKLFELLITNFLVFNGESLLVRQS